MIQTTEDILAVIKSDSETLTSDLIASLVKDARHNEGARRQKLWDRYNLKNIPIQFKKLANYEKEFDRIANDFYADVVDTKTGYMGNEVTTGLIREEYEVNNNLNEVVYDKDRKFLHDYQVMSNSEDKNSEQVRMAGATGLGYRLLYIPEGKNEVKTMNLKPWEVIYVYDDSLDEPTLAIRFYTMQVEEFGFFGKNKEITKVEWYDNKNVTYYKDDGDMRFFVDQSKGIDGVQPHLLDGIPIIPFPNNEETTAEPEKVVSLIDAYDTVTSSTVSEIEQLRLAYMFIKGSGLMVDEPFMKQLEQTGMFPLEGDGEIGFVNKELFDAPIHNILAELRKNIYQFSKSVDMSKDFGGDMRVIGWQVTLLNLENSCKITERKFKRALRRQYELLTSYWKKYMGVSINPYNLEFTFTRNFPRDIRAEAETLQFLLASVSKKTAFSQMSFIDDPEAEITAMEGETDPFREVDNVKKPIPEQQ